MSSPIGITFREPAENTTITEVVREKYGAAARRVLDLNAPTSCCGPTSSMPSGH